MDADRKQDRRTDPQIVDLTTMLKDATDTAGRVSTERFIERLHGVVQRALDAGQSVTLYSDGRPSNVVSIERGMLRDDKGQRWGSLPLMTDPEGKLGNRLTIEGLEREQKPSPSQGVETLRPRAIVPAALRTDEAGVRAAAAEVARRATSGFAPPSNDNWSFQYKGHDLIAWQRQPGVVDVLNTKLELLFSGRTAQELNSVSPEPARPKPIDVGTDAQLREAAKGTIAANDRQAEAKREVVEHLTTDELKRFAAAGADKPKAEQVLRDAAAREERASATGAVRDPAPPLADRFNISRRLFTKEYEFRDQPGKIAFSERFNKLRSEHNTPAAAIAMIDRAGERGWSSVRVTGSAEFKRQAWIAAEARGIKAIGYEPTKGDIEAARAERERLARETTWRGGSVERAHEQRTQEQRTPSQVPRETAPPSRQPDSRSTAEPAERAQDPMATASAARRHEEATRREPNADNDRISWAKEERKAAEFVAMAGTANRTEQARGAAAPDIPSMAGSGAQRDEKDRQDQRRRGTANPERDREPEQTVLRAVSSAAFMRALEQVMERDGVPMERRPEIRTVAERQFAALRAEGKTVRVPLVDREAPRRVPVQLPQYEVKRAAQERAR